MARDAEPHVLPDVLQPGLTLVFCGTAAGKRSAAEGAYYAHPGNLFWRALHSAQLTPRLFAPAEFPQLPHYGIGLTDLAKRHSGNDSELPRDAFDVAALLAKIERYRPRLLAFTSKNAARAVLADCQTLLGRAANPAVRSTIRRLMSIEPLWADETSKICPRTAEFSPRPAKPDRLLADTATPATPCWKWWWCWRSWRWSPAWPRCACFR